MNHLSPLSESCSDKDALTPLSGEDFKGLFSGQEINIKIWNQIFFLTLLDQEREGSIPNRFLFASEEGVAIADIFFSPEDASWDKGDMYGHHLGALYQVLEQLNKQGNDAKRYAEISDISKATNHGSLNILKTP